MRMERPRLGRALLGVQLRAQLVARDARDAGFLIDGSRFDGKNAVGRNASATSPVRYDLRAHAELFGELREPARQFNRFVQCLHVGTF